MSGAGNSLGPCLLVVWGLFVGVFWRVMDLWTGYPISTLSHSPVQLLPGKKSPKGLWSWGGLSDEAWFPSKVPLGCSQCEEGGMSGYGRD